MPALCRSSKCSKCPQLHPLKIVSLFPELHRELNELQLICNGLPPIERPSWSSGRDSDLVWMLLADISNTVTVYRRPSQTGTYNVRCSRWNLTEFVDPSLMNAVYHLLQRKFIQPTATSDAEHIVNDWYLPTCVFSVPLQATVIASADGWHEISEPKSLPPATLPVEHPAVRLATSTSQNHRCAAILTPKFDTPSFVYYRSSSPQPPPRPVGVPVLYC